MLVKSNNKTELDLIGKAWPNKTVFLDFINSDTQSLWLDGLKDLHNQAIMDGILINLDEINYFCDKEWHNNGIVIEKDNSSIPFNPFSDHFSVQNRGLLLDTQYFNHDESDKELNIEYNIHSLYGTMVANATYQFWKGNSTLNSNFYLY